MTGPITHVDFGKRQREAARMFARLLGLCEARSADILARPEYYMQQAADEIHQLRGKLRDAQDALRMTPPLYMAPDEPIRCLMDTVRVPREDYDRLRKCADIVESARQ